MLRLSVCIAVLAGRLALAADVPEPIPDRAQLETILKSLRKASLAEPKPREVHPGPTKVPHPTTVDLSAAAATKRHEFINRMAHYLPSHHPARSRLLEVHHRLATAYAETARYVLLHEDTPSKRTEADVLGTCAWKNGQRKCRHKPQLLRLGELYRLMAVQLFRGLYSEDPPYPRHGEVAFALAGELMELATLPDRTIRKALRREATTLYRDTIVLLPNTSFACDAATELGTILFEDAQFAPARHTFEDATEPTCPDTTTYATYRLAWCEYELGEYANAVQRFKDVITLSAPPTADKIPLKTEALRDIVFAFAKADEVEAAIAYLEEVAGREEAKPLIHRLAELYFARGAYAVAERVYRHLTISFPADEEWSSWQTRIVLCFDRTKQRDKSLDEIKTLLRHDASLTQER